MPGPTNIAGFGCCGGGSGTSGGGHIPGCLCDPMPASISMTSDNPDCNMGMYQSCTITWQVPPDWAASLDIGSMAYLSDESFPDAIGGGAMFYYLLTCYSNQIRLSRIYRTSPYGSPYRDGLLYSWQVNYSIGNTCSPFAMIVGTSFEGSDETCVVTLEGLDD